MKLVIQTGMIDVYISAFKDIGNIPSFYIHHALMVLLQGAAQHQQRYVQVAALVSCNSIVLFFGDRF